MTFQLLLGVRSSIYEFTGGGSPDSLLPSESADDIALPETERSRYAPYPVCPPGISLQNSQHGFFHYNIIMFPKPAKQIYTYNS